jgi:methanogenic corrinoid protein MtbC1
MLTANGFEVYDIGEDVPAEKFVEKVKELKPDVVGLSALLTTTLPEQRTVIEALKKEGLRDKVKVIIGGAPASREWAEEIGADGYGADAAEAVEVVKRLLGYSK